MRLAVALLTALLLAPGASPSRPVFDAHDRAAVLAWFTLLADAQFYRPTSDVTDCAGLVRHAAREALRAHTPEWHRRIALPGGQTRTEPRVRLAAANGVLPIFRVTDGPSPTYAEFADARTILRLNATFISRDPASAREGDLLAFQQSGQRLPEHLMVFVGRSAYERGRGDWVVYHTGPDLAADTPGEMRKATLADLRRHPASRWRPERDNPAFLGVYRLRIP